MGAAAALREGDHLEAGESAGSPLQMLIGGAQRLHDRLPRGRVRSVDTHGGGLQGSIQTLPRLREMSMMMERTVWNRLPSDDVPRLCLFVTDPFEDVVCRLIAGANRRENHQSRELTDAFSHQV